MARLPHGPMEWGRTCYVLKQVAGLQCRVYETLFVAFPKLSKPRLACPGGAAQTRSATLRPTGGQKAESDPTCNELEEVQGLHADQILQGGQDLAAKACQRDACLEAALDEAAVQLLPWQSSCHAPLMTKLQRLHGLHVHGDQVGWHCQVEHTES